MSADAIHFKKSHEDIIERTFKHIPATRPDRQKAIYISYMGNDGLVPPVPGNQKIRDELSRDAINSIDRVTMELTIYLWRNVGKIIGWISNKLYNMPEIRSEMVGSSDMEESLLRKAFDSLIQRLARPATDIFLSYPRTKMNRLKVLREYQMELMIIDNFVENGRIKSRGIIPFIANGKLGKFQFDLAFEERLVINKSKEETISLSGFDHSSMQSSKLDKLSSKNKTKQTSLSKNDEKVKQLEDSTIKNKVKGFFSKTKPDSTLKRCPVCTAFFDKKLNFCDTCDNKYENFSKRFD